MHSEYIHDAYTSKTHAACDAINVEFAMLMLRSCCQSVVNAQQLYRFDSFNCSNNHVYISNDNYMQEDECLQL